MFGGTTGTIWLETYTIKMLQKIWAQGEGMQEEATTTMVTKTGSAAGGIRSKGRRQG